MMYNLQVLLKAHNTIIAYFDDWKEIYSFIYINIENNYKSIFLEILFTVYYFLASDLPKTSGRSDLWSILANMSIMMTDGPKL